MARSGQKQQEAELFAELKELYRDADALFSGSHCELSTECCRFGITGREPQVTSIELALVNKAVGARGGVPAEKKRALPITDDEKRERVCPLLGRDRRCSIYEARPLGCRTFYCRRATHEQEPGRAELRELVRRLQELAQRHAPGGDKPRALTAALAR